jgi:hypothetical protein
MNPLHLASTCFTLLIEDRGAKLWDAEGQLLAMLPEVSAGETDKSIWGELLREHLPKGAEVQILVARGNLDIQCQAAPYLSVREQGEVVRRLVHADGPEQTGNFAYAFDGDPLAEGGHRLWVARHPAEEMEAWLAALSYAGASLVFATPWMRAFLAGMEGDASMHFYLALEPAGGRLLLYRGRELILMRMRAFPLPEGLDLYDLDDASSEILAEVVLEEASRTIQFIKQKHRSIALEDLHIVGLPALPTPLVARLERGLRLAIKSAGPSLPAFLLRGMDRERSHKGGLNLVPVHIQDARRIHLLRITVWTAAVCMLLGLGAAQAILMQNERSLKQTLASSEVARDQRRRLTQEAERVGKLRFGMLRLRHAEQRQKDSLEQLERLGITLFDVPLGITLDKVNVTQVPGDGIRFRFEISGTALTSRRLSVGPLADYLQRLENHAGMQLDPLREVSVSDRTALAGQAVGLTERAITRFKLSGSSS